MINKSDNASGDLKRALSKCFRRMGQTKLSAKRRESKSILINFPENLNSTLKFIVSKEPALDLYKWVKDFGKTDTITSKVPNKSETGGIHKMQYGSAKANDFIKESNNEHPEKENIFLFEDSRWIIKFGGHKLYLPDLLGLRYINILIIHTNRPIHVLHLVDILNGRKTDFDEYYRIRQEVLDRRALNSVKARLSKLEQHYVIAKNRNDINLCSKIEEEKNKLNNLMKMDANIRKKSRYFNSSAEKARKSIKRCISYTQNKIRIKHPELYRHLLNSISTGIHCTYKPESDISWKI